MESLPQEILSAWKQITSKTLAAESSVQGSSIKRTWVWKTGGDQDVLALSSFPSLAGGSLTLKAGEGAARFQID